MPDLTAIHQPGIISSHLARRMSLRTQPKRRFSDWFLTIISIAWAAVMLVLFLNQR